MSLFLQFVLHFTHPNLVAGNKLNETGLHMSLLMYVSPTNKQTSKKQSITFSTVNTLASSSEQLDNPILQDGGLDLKATWTKNLDEEFSKLLLSYNNNPDRLVQASAMQESENMQKSVEQPRVLLFQANGNKTKHSTIMVQKSIIRQKERFGANRKSRLLITSDKMNRCI